MKVRIYVYKDKCDVIETEWIYDDGSCFRTKQLVYHQYLNRYIDEDIKSWERQGVEVEVLSGNAT